MLSPWLIRRVLSIAVLSATALPSPLGAQSADRDSISTLRGAAEATSRFVAQWRTEWLTSDWEAWVAFQSAGGVRRPSTYNAPLWEKHWCTYAWAPPLGLADPRRSSNRIGSAGPLPSLNCPSWTVANPQYSDASTVLDSALTPARRELIATARDSLLRTLAAAGTTQPGDEWIIRQRVRFLLDQSYQNVSHAHAALDVARKCRSDRWLCESLVGFVHWHQRMLDSADAAFGRARDASGTALQCQLADVLGLMDRKAVPREFVPPETCAERRALSARYWWLADPRWSDAINERRVEHDARTVALLLNSSLPRGERFDWSVADGGDAAAQLITRYGWPSRMVSSAINQGRLVRPSRAGIRFRNGVDPFDAAPSPPFTTQEYNVGRIHVGPSWTALTDPFTARASDWQFSAPLGDDARKWWPSEHMRRDRALVAVADWQEQY